VRTLKRKSFGLKPELAQLLALMMVVSGCATATGGALEGEEVHLGVDDPTMDGSDVSEVPSNAPTRPSTGWVDVPDPNFHEDIILGTETLGDEESDPASPVDPTMPVVVTNGGDGYLIDGVCYSACVSDSGGSEGWGWESDATCVASGSLAASRGSSCGAGSDDDGGGISVDGICYPACLSDLGDSSGWGWENDATCVVAGSAVASGGSSCGGSSGGGGGEVDGRLIAHESGSCPSTFLCPSGAECGCYTVSGLGARKAQLLDAGAEPYMLAAAMMETETMTTDYTYGDGKWDDSFNAGVCKQNWFMMRQCYEPWRGLESWQYETSAGLNSQVELDVQVFSSCRAYFGSSWWAGHRNGQSGIENPSTWDIENFRNAMDWTHHMIGTEHLRDDVRFWVQIGVI